MGRMLIVRTPSLVRLVVAQSLAVAPLLGCAGTGDPPASTSDAVAQTDTPAATGEVASQPADGLEVTLSSAGLALRLAGGAGKSLTITQGKTVVTLDATNGTVTLAPSALTKLSALVEGDAQVSVDGSASQTVRLAPIFPYIAFPSPATPPTLAGLTTRMPQGTAHVTGAAPKAGMRAAIKVASPIGKVTTVTAGQGAVLKDGAAISFDVTFDADGLWLVEVNDPGGVALLITPVYVGGTVPLVLDLLGKNPTVAYAAPLPMKELRQKVLAGVNALRVGLGLTAVVAHPKADGTAQEKADDMADAGYFGHTSPSGKTQKSRFAAAGLTGTFAETLVQDVNPERAVRKLTLSPSHLAELTDPRWLSAGVGGAVHPNTLVDFVIHFSDQAP